MEKWFWELIPELYVWKSCDFSKRSVFHYLYWAVTGPSCTGTRHRTPAVWQTHYRSSASARTGRSWRATSYVLWKEGDERWGKGGSRDEGKEMGEVYNRWRQRGKKWRKTDRRETYRLDLKLFHSSSYSILKQPQQGSTSNAQEKTGLRNQSWWIFTPHFHYNTAHITLYL